MGSRPMCHSLRSSSQAFSLNAQLLTGWIPAPPAASADGQGTARLRLSMYWGQVAALLRVSASRMLLFAAPTGDLSAADSLA